MKNILKTFWLMLPLMLAMACGGGGGSSSQNSTDSTWSSSLTGSLNTAREDHTATLLSTGKILIAGGRNSNGALATTELYDPATRAFTYSGSMTTARECHTATLLSNGKVLIAGGGSISAEIYDPTTGICTLTGSMTEARANHTANLLSTGKVLIAGGDSQPDGGTGLATAELYDPSTGTFSATGSMGTGRTNHSATLLGSGTVLIAGGLIGSDQSYIGGWLPTATAELYDPTSGTFSYTGSLKQKQYDHTATLLASGKILIAGGTASNNPLYIGKDAELYDPSTAVFSSTGSAVTARWGARAILTSDGNVLLFGGYSTSDTSLSTNEAYKTSAGTFSNITNLQGGRNNHTATKLANGKILIVGGHQWALGDTGILATAEIYSSAD